LQKTRGWAIRSSDQSETKRQNHVASFLIRHFLVSFSATNLLNYDGSEFGPNTANKLRVNLPAPASLLNVPGLGSAPATMSEFAAPSTGVVPIRPGIGGLASKGSFHAALKDLLPADESTAAKSLAEKTPGAVGTAFDAVAVQVAPRQVLPFAFALPREQAGAATEQPGLQQQNEFGQVGADAVAQTSQDLIAQLEEPEKPAFSPVRASKPDSPKIISNKNRIQATQSKANADSTMRLKALPLALDPVAEPQLPQPAEAAQPKAERAQPPHDGPAAGPLAGMVARQPTPVVEPSTRGIADTRSIEPQFRVSAEEEAGARELPNLAFDMRLTAVGTVPSPGVVHGALNPAVAEVLPPPSAKPGSETNALRSTNPELTGESTRHAADETKPIAPAKSSESGHGSDHRGQNEASGHTSPDPDTFSAAWKESATRVNLAGEKTAVSLPAVIDAPQAESSVRADTARMTEMRPPQPATESAPATNPNPAEAHTISLRFSDTEDQRVELRVTDRAGEVRVVVRTADPDVATPLRDNLGDLVHKLDQSGFRAEAWHPAQSAATDSQPQQGRSQDQSLSGNPHGDRQQQQQNRDRREQEQERGRWSQEMEDSLASDSERSAPAWAPVSIR
jgi:hypothetical protein